ncbi:MAG: hypothetical protein LW817_00165 [Candidatus Caenarcaniphilales bacterium]|jgi:hypothetical protein|nr:hypothetical protein [Candidatus Caenarcaniphilales bacterium]
MNNRAAIFNITALVFVMAFVLGFVNIHFNVANQKLSREIEELEDEKAILRSQYLSEVSLLKLQSRADEMQMKRASTTECHKVSSKIEQLYSTKLIQVKEAKRSKEPIRIVTGY